MEQELNYSEVQNGSPPIIEAQEEQPTKPLSQMQEEVQSRRVSIDMPPEELPKDLSIPMKTEEVSEETNVKKNNIIMAFGSAECDQFVNDDDVYERKRPIEIIIPEMMITDKIMSITCGSQHALILSEMGKVYSFGNSDLKNLH